MQLLPSFTALTPEKILSSVEEFCGFFLNGVLTPYNSYINRVYGIQNDETDERYIVKFYRPGRWSKAAVLEEHHFLRQCGDEEIPVIPPMPARKHHDKKSMKEETIGEVDGFLFAVFPLRSGRQLDITSDQDWVRLGSIIGRMHAVGKREETLHRIICSPEASTQAHCRELLEKGLVHPNCAEEFKSITQETLELIQPVFKDTGISRIHGDCHRGNILDRLEQGLILIDFDDMMMGPPVQDLWLLLPGHLTDCRTEMDLLLYGYTQFTDFDRTSLQLIEPLRFMRIIYFLTWSALQIEDRTFQHNFPNWGTEHFWIREIEDLRYQLQMIREHLADDSITWG